MLADPSPVGSARQAPSRRLLRERDGQISRDSPRRHAEGATGVLTSTFGVRRSSSLRLRLPPKPK